MNRGTIVVAFWSGTGMPPWGSTPFRVASVTDIQATTKGPIHEGQEHLLRFKEGHHPVIILEYLDDTTLAEEAVRVFASHTSDMVNLEKRGARHVELLKTKAASLQLLVSGTVTRSVMQPVFDLIKLEEEPEIDFQQVDSDNEAEHFSTTRMRAVSAASQLDVHHTGDHSDFSAIPTVAPAEGSKNVQLADPVSKPSTSKAVVNVKEQHRTVEYPMDLLVRDAFAVAEALKAVCTYCLDHQFEPEDDPVILKCSGECMKHFRVQCLNQAGHTDVDTSVQFKCPECVSGDRVCFSCKVPGSDLVKCPESGCGQFYHLACLLVSSGKNRGPSSTEKLPACPLHHCHTCTRLGRDSNTGDVDKSSLAKCNCCPTAYHFHDMCFPADTTICPGNTTVMTCFKHPGELLVCDTCPFIADLKCAGLDSVPEGPWQCADCANGVKPMVLDIVSYKSPRCRVWPCQILPEQMVPDNVLQKRPPGSGFVLQFLGTSDYAFALSCEVLPYESFDPAWEHHPEKDKGFAEEEDAQICECMPSDTDPCGPTSHCLNRVVQYECSYKHCPTGGLCKNQRMGRKEYPRMEIFYTAIRGWALGTLQDIEKDDLIVEYVGEIITVEERDRRVKKKLASGDGMFYFLYLTKDRVLDAGLAGNLARFANYSCDANSLSQKWIVDGDTHIALIAKRHILSGAEITCDYCWECESGVTSRQCLCGADNCRRMMGGKTGTEKKRGRDSTAKASSSPLTTVTSLHQ